MSKLWVLGVVVWLAALPARVDAQFFFETFDSYATGSMIAGQGGWETWDNAPAANTTVVSTQSFSAPNSLLTAGTSDIVHSFVGVTSGVWYVREWVFIPSTQTGESWFILLNTYVPNVHNGNLDWSAQVVFCRTGCTTAGVVPGMVTSIGGSEITVVGTTPLILDQWVEIRARIDLTLNRYQLFYNGVQFYDQPWVVNAPLRFQTVDLYGGAPGAPTSPTFMDGVWVDQTFPVTGTSFSVE